MRVSTIGTGDEKLKQDMKTKKKQKKKQRKNGRTPDNIFLYHFFFVLLI